MVSGGKCNDKIGRHFGKQPAKIQHHNYPVAVGRVVQQAAANIRDGHGRERQVHKIHNPNQPAIGRSNSGYRCPASGITRAGDFIGGGINRGCCGKTGVIVIQCELERIAGAGREVV